MVVESSNLYQAIDAAAPEMKKNKIREVFDPRYENMTDATKEATISEDTEA